MLVAARTPVQVGMVAWAGPTPTVTVVVGRTFDLVPRGIGGPSQEQDPLRLDTVDGDLLVFPTDFAPAKLSCDVLVVGRALAGSVGPVRVVLDPLRVLEERASRLGPRGGVGDLGDPTDPAVGSAWAQPGFDFEGFQSASRDRRLPFPSLPLDVVVDYGEQRFVTRIEGPTPEALLLDQHGWTAPTWIALRVDKVAIDPERRKIALVWRGVVALPEGADPLLVVEVGAPLRSMQPWDMLRWPRAEAIEAHVLRRLARLARSDVRRAGPRGTAAIDDSGEEVAESTLTLQVEPVAIAPALVEPQGPLRPGDLEAETMDPPQLAARVAGAVVTAPVFGPPPPRPSSPSPSSATAAHDPLVETRHSPSPSHPSLQAAIVARRASIGPASVHPDTQSADPESDDSMLGTSTVMVQVPAELLGPALPFATRSPPPERASPVPSRAEVQPAREAGVGATLPFVRTRAATRPLPEPEPPPRAPSETRGDTEGEENDPLVGTVMSPRSPAAPALPFRPAGARAPLEAPAAPATVVRPTASAPAFVATPFAPPFAAPAVVAPPPAFAEPREAAPIAPPAAVLLGVAARLGAPALPTHPGGGPATAAAPPASPAAPPTGISAEEYVEIKVALWADVEGRRATLERHGLTELKWRLVEKRFSADLARRRPDEVHAVVARLRQAARFASKPLAGT